MISNLLDELLAHRVLNQAEVDEVQEANPVTTDKARSLIDRVRLKGPRASAIFIDSLRKHDSNLAEQLGLSAGAGERQSHNPPWPCLCFQCFLWHAGGGPACWPKPKPWGSQEIPLSLCCGSGYPSPRGDSRALRWLLPVGIHYGAETGSACPHAL